MEVDRIENPLAGIVPPPVLHPRSGVSVSGVSVLMPDWHSIASTSHSTNRSHNTIIDCLVFYLFLSLKRCFLLIFSN